MPITILPQDQDRQELLTRFLLFSIFGIGKLPRKCYAHDQKELTPP